MKKKNSSPFAVNDQFYHRVFESIEDYAVFTTDTAGLITTWNTDAEHVLGYREREVLHQNCALLFTQTDIETQEHNKELSNALKHGRAIDERFHVKKGGHRFWASGKVFPIYDGKVHIGFTKIMRNLTDVLQAEERATRARRYSEDIIAWAVEPIMVLNDDLTVNTVNKAFRDNFGVASQKNYDIRWISLPAGFSASRDLPRSRVS